MKSVWVTTGMTESGDVIQPLVWGSRPTQNTVEAVLKELYPTEYEEVGFINNTTSKCPVL